MEGFLSRVKEPFSGSSIHLNLRKPLRIGSGAKDFKAPSTPYTLNGEIENEVSFHSYIRNRWAVLFSHPCDFTPVCTTEIVAFAEKQEEFDKRDVRLVGISVGTLKNHNKWLYLIHNKILANTGIRVNFPIVADDGAIAKDYDMLDKEENVTREDIDGCKKKLHTIRSVFIIGPDKRIRLIQLYPMETGRSIKEILRVIDSLQAHEEGDHIKTGADWQPDDGYAIFREDDEAKEKGLWPASDIDDRYGIPWLKYIKVPKEQLRGFRPRQNSAYQHTQKAELAIATPIESNSNVSRGGPSSGNSL